MSGWAIAAILGGIFGVLIIVVLVMVSKAVMRTAQNAAELMQAMEEVQARTAVLVDLEARAASATRIGEEAEAALHELDLRDRKEGNGHGGV